MAKTKFNWYAPSNWQTVIICHVYQEIQVGDTRSSRKVLLSISHCLLYLSLELSMDGSYFFYLFIFFCHSIFVQFSFPFLSTDKHSSVARTAKCICICNGIVTAQHKWKWRLSRVPRRVGVGVERASLKSRESRTMQCPWHWWRIGRQLDGQIFIIASCGVFIKSNLLTSSEEIR